jgi:cytochrome c553
MMVTRSAWLMAMFAGAVVAQVPNQEQAEFFEKNVRPVLAQKCQMCHNAKVKTSALDMSSAAAFMAGGGSGSLVNVESPEQSLLLQVTSYEGKLKMPPMGKLKDHEISALREWITMGAPWPGYDPKAGVVAAGGSGTRKHGNKLTEEDKQFWAFQPVKPQQPPAVKNKAWVQAPIDAFLLAKFEEKGVKPAPPADRLTLLRRATYDLTGLPPTEAEMKAFLADRSPDAFRKVVDRLLASPRYGEKWGRHWLDIARYADSTGNDEDHRYPYAFKYRDYVINAFNEDLPYNQFVKEQVAGDLLPARHGKLGLNREGIIATGFLALGAKAIAQQDKQKMLYDIYDEQVDVVSKTFLGVTLACARCHDHKFDPLYAKDYYGMVGIFASTKNFKDDQSHVSKLLFTPLVPKEQYDKYEAAEALVQHKQIDLEIAIEKERRRLQEKLVPQIPAYMMAAREVERKKADEAAVAKVRQLDEKMLGRWVKYFAAREVPRPWLAAWDSAADDAAAQQIANGFVSSTMESLAGWHKRLEAYRKPQRRQIEEKNMLSEKPKMINEKDRFFGQVFDNSGPMGVSDAAVKAEASAAAQAEFAALQAEQKRLKESLPPEPEMACAVQEGTPVQQKVFIRGDYGSLGEDAPKRFPIVMAGDRQPQNVQGSGRLELAEWLASPENPLSARVMVNRIWQGHFGEGIVRTPDNFGRMGERPTHPELLDFLATEFVQSGWSVKAMHRKLMLSSAYQMSSATSPEQFQADPENKLFSRAVRRRLQVEEMRDALLGIAGKLDLRMGGSMQSGFGTDGENSSGRLSINPEEQVRRTVYLPLRRANLPALFNLFDFGDATTPQGRRIITNVAPQALFMMNSKFVADQAQTLAETLVKETPAGRPRVDRAISRILNREASPAEADAMLSFVDSFQKKFAGKMTEADAWQSACRVLIASNEFMYVD